MWSQRLLSSPRSLLAPLQLSTRLHQLPQLQQLRRSSFKRPDAYRSPRRSFSPNNRRDPKREDQGKKPENNQSENEQTGESQSAASPLSNLSSALHDTDPSSNSLLAPVHIPEDPNAVLKSTHPAASILANSGLVVQRQLEMMNVLIGFEQANRYVLLDARGNHIGYMAEQDDSIGKTIARQWAGTYRSVVTWVFDRQGKEVLRFHRPFSFINSRIRVYDPISPTDKSVPPSSVSQTTPLDLASPPAGAAQVSSLPMENMRVIGEAHQVWHLLRRKYDLFLFHESPNKETNLGWQPVPFEKSGLSQTQQLQVLKDTTHDQGGGFHQFAYVDEPFLSWDFSLKTADNRLIGSVNRNFTGFAREIFTDMGVYALRMDSIRPETEAMRPSSPPLGMTLDQRAVMLATAVSVDFDYFSRHSNSHGGILPFPIPFFGWGGSAAEGAGAGAGAAEAGAAGALAGEGAGSAAAAGMAGAGTIAGYEAMHGGVGSGSGSSENNQGVNPQDGQQAPQQAVEQGQLHEQQEQGQQMFDEKPWWEQDQEVQQRESNPWGRQEEDDGWGYGDGDGGGDGGDWTDDFF